MSEWIELSGRRLAIAPLDVGRQGEACARLMSASEPWITLGRTEERARRVLETPGQEGWVVTGEDGAVAALLLLMLQGALVGYVRSIVVRPEWRSRGLGEAVMRFAEGRIRSVSPHVFLMVSSFNEGAQRFYERLGYQRVGEIPEFLVPGHSELLMWKHLGES